MLSHGEKWAFGLVQWRQCYGGRRLLLISQGQGCCRGRGGHGRFMNAEVRCMVETAALGSD